VGIDRLVMLLNATRFDSGCAAVPPTFASEASPSASDSEGRLAGENSVLFRFAGGPRLQKIHGPWASFFTLNNMSYLWSVAALTAGVRDDLLIVEDQRRNGTMLRHLVEDIRMEIQVPDFSRPGARLLWSQKPRPTWSSSFTACRR